MEYGTLKDANVTIDQDDGSVWLWVKAGSEHVAIKLTEQLQPEFHDTVVKWAVENGADPPSSTE